MPQYLLEVVVGICAGAIVAALISVVFKRPANFVKDAMLGAIGFIGGVAITPHLPWRINTVTRHVGDAIVTTTSHRFQHPYRIALLLAFLLPIVYELIRMRFGRSAR
jgi:hypothetical protein